MKNHSNYAKEWYLKNRSRILELRKQNYILTRSDKIAYQRQYAKKVKEEMFKLLGSICVCCGETNRKFLTLDHIKGGGHKQRRAIGVYQSYFIARKLGWSKEVYQILCWNCNCGRAYNKSICPHLDQKS